MKLSYIFLCLLFFCESPHAERFTPTDANTIIATWPIVSSPALQQAQAAKRLHPSDPTTVVTLANNYLALAGMPGQSRLYGLAQAALKPLIDNATNNTQAWLAWAQVLQHQHVFNDALDAIAKVTASDPKNINANLLAARIYLIQDKPAQARQSCLKLLGYSDLLTMSTCVLEITSHQPEQLLESYNQLTTLVKREGFPTDERGPWIAQVLADMAVRMNNSKAAEEWLTPQLNNATVNYLAQWSDVQLTQGNYEKVISFLTPIVKSASEVDDLLLLQLAIAEKQLSDKGHEKEWQSQLAARVLLREQRQDSQHANELARYYLDVNPQPQKALYWAKLHFENSREYNDKKLLERAQIAVDSQNTTSSPEEK